MDPEKAKRYGPIESFFKYTTRDAIIYALGIGATTSQDLHFIYENHENFQVFPTYVVAAGLLANSLSDWPGIVFDLQKILHGEQYTEVFAPLPAEDAELRSEVRVLDILDKTTGALILSEVTTFNNATGQKLACQQFGVFQVGGGGFGGLRNSPSEIKALEVPKSSPQKVVEEFISREQAALYRLGGGDLNPLHIDAEFAKISGFKEPILHGLCTLGFASRQILREFGNNDAKNFKAIKVRFSNPILPGQTLRTEMWKKGNRIQFQSLVKETGKIVISSGYMDLHNVQSSKTFDNIPEKVQQEHGIVKSKEVFDLIGKEMANYKSAMAKIDAIVVYYITKNSKLAATFTLDLKKGANSVYEGNPKNNEKPSVTVTVDDEDFLKIVNGKLDGIKAFMTGRLKTKGNIMLLQKLQSILAAGRKANQKSKI